MNGIIEKNKKTTKYIYFNILYLCFISLITILNSLWNFLFIPFTITLFLLLLSIEKIDKFDVIRDIEKTFKINKNLKLVDNEIIVINNLNKLYKNIIYIEKHKKILNFKKFKFYKLLKEEIEKNKIKFEREKINYIINNIEKYINDKIYGEEIKNSLI